MKRASWAAVLVCGAIACGGGSTPPAQNAPEAVHAPALANCVVPPDIGDLVKHAFGSYEGLFQVAHPRYFATLYCGIGSEVSRSPEVRRAWAELDFSEFSEGASFEEAVLRFAVARATYSLSVALQHGHIRATPGKLDALDALSATGDRRALPFVYGYALRVAGSLSVDPDLRVALLATLGRLSGKRADPMAAYDPERFRAAVASYDAELP